MAPMHCSEGLNMTPPTRADWTIRDAATQADPRAAYDRMREHCPVAHDTAGHWTLFRHADVRAVLLDHTQFSNRVSQHVSVPNGMDPPEHGPFRHLIEPYFSEQRVAWFRPLCRAIADDLAQPLQGRDAVDIMADFALPFALRAQCAFMGWPQSLQQRLQDWIQLSHQARFAQDRPALAQLAAAFDAMIDEQLAQRRQSAAAQEADITSELMRSRVNGRPLSDAEMASILRNWTVGEVGTLAAAIGIIAHYLADHAALQQRLRAQPEQLYYANDEIQRMHNPLLENRRRATCPVELGGRQIGQDEQVVINWVAANRDPRVFAEPDCFRWGRNPQDNLLYGAGIHVCPGAPMARMELVEVMDSLLQHSHTLQPVAGRPAVPARYPASGYAQVWLTGF